MLCKPTPLSILAIVGFGIATAAQQTTGAWLGRFALLLSGLSTLAVCRPLSNLGCGGHNSFRPVWVHVDVDCHLFHTLMD